MAYVAPPSLVLIIRILTRTFSVQIIGVPTALEVTPNKYRPWTQGFMMTLASVAVIAGTLAAGAFVKFYDQGWRWSYYLNACVYGTTCLLNLVFYHPPPTSLRRQETSATRLLAQVDYIGIFIFAGSLASLMIGLTWGGTTYDWNSSQVLASLIMGCVGLVGFGLYETFGTSVGILDHRLFPTRNFAILTFVTTVDGMLLLGVNVVFSQQIALMFTSDTLLVAADLMPYLVLSAFGCLPAGWLMGKTQRYRLLLIVALAWCSLFLGMIPSHHKDLRTDLSSVTRDMLTACAQVSWQYSMLTALSTSTHSRPCLVLEQP